MAVILKETEAEDFLERHGFPVVERRVGRSLAELRSAARALGFPGGLKNPTALHKTEQHAVRMDVTEATLEAAYRALGGRRVLVQRQLRGVELLIGLKRDAVFGAVAACGLGGVTTELFKDVAFRVCPLTRNDAVSMLHSLHAARLFEGFRGIRASAKAVAALLLKVSALAERYPELEELDVNPLIVTEREARIADARMVFAHLRRR